MRRLLILSAFTLIVPLLTGCGKSSGVSSADACRVLNLARGYALDLSVTMVGRQNPDNLYEFLPPTSETADKVHATEKSLTDLADSLGSGDKADLARVFAQDFENVLQGFSPQMPLSGEASAAIANDMASVTSLCGY